jgi:hypothetical protein
MLFVSLSQRSLSFKTMQKKVFLVVFALAVLRSGFFAVASDSWDADSGVVAHNQLSFYALDEFATMLFFTLSSVLALFWAEICYIAVDNVRHYKFFIRPITYVVNLGAFVGVACCVYFINTQDSSDTDYYFFIKYTLFVAILFLLAAIFFAYFANRTVRQLNKTPLLISTRSERITILRVISNIFIFVLVCRATIVLALSEQSLTTSSDVQLFLVSVYYLLLEFLPAVTALVFYRAHRIEAEDDYVDEDAEPWETIPIGHFHDDEEEAAAGAAAAGNTLPSSSSTSSSLSPDNEVIDQLIKRLSAADGYR